MAGKAFHRYPEKCRAIPCADLFHRGACCVVNFLDIATIDLLPIARFKNTQCQRIGFASRHADAIGVIFDDEQERQFLFLSERNSFEEIALARRGVANRCDHEIFFAIEFNAPRDSACGQEL